MRMRAVFQNQTSVVFGLSISGETKDVLYLLREAHKNGSRTILITSRNKEGFDEICDELVLVPSLKYLDHGNVISPQFPILVMLDVIYSYYIEQDKQEKEEWHVDTVRAVKKMK